MFAIYQSLVISVDGHLVACTETMLSIVTFAGLLLFCNDWRFDIAIHLDHHGHHRRGTSHQLRSPQDCRGISWSVQVGDFRLISFTFSLVSLISVASIPLQEIQQSILPVLVAIKIKLSIILLFLARKLWNLVKLHVDFRSAKLKTFRRQEVRVELFPAGKRASEQLRAVQGREGHLHRSDQCQRPISSWEDDGRRRGSHQQEAEQCQVQEELQQVSLVSLCLWRRINCKQMQISHS